jgi:hypothetical protein
MQILLKVLGIKIIKKLILLCMSIHPHQEVKKIQGKNLIMLSEILILIKHIKNTSIIKFNLIKVFLNQNHQNLIIIVKNK